MNLRKNKQKTNGVIWKDSRKLEFFTLIVLFVLFLIFMIIIFRNSGFLGKTILYILIAFFSISLVKQFGRRVITIEKKGIWTGNVKFVSYGKFKTTEKEIFIEWKNIKYIKFKNHIVAPSYVGIPRPFLVIKKKNNKSYVKGIQDVKGFIEALKKLNKYNLIAKDSRYK